MDPRALPPRLVIDPSLPEEISVQLRAHPQVLRMARTGARPERSFDPTLLIVGSVMLFLILATVGLPGMIGGAFAMSVIGFMRWMVAGSTTRTARRRLRLAQDHAARYVLPEDLDYPCQRLLRRAQDAVSTVLRSRVHQAGLIDTIDNQVTLPEEVWQIAQRLARLSAMHAEHRRLVPRDLPPGLEDAVKPYSTALDAAWTSLSKRVRHLEQYAKQVLRADRVFHAHQRLEALAARTPDYQRLIADTVRDEMAHAHIRRLGEQAQHVRELFEESIHEARRTAGELLRSPLSVTDPIPSPGPPAAVPGAGLRAPAAGRPTGRLAAPPPPDAPAAPPPTGIAPPPTEPAAASPPPGAAPPPTEPAAAPPAAGAAAPPADDPSAPTVPFRVPSAGGTAAPLPPPAEDPLGSPGTRRRPSRP
ncbi:hypothetical protein ACGF0J_37670 [Nonomuraea sp. NPDC047897]|uniref:hypothetical protein n=1 Tax=Nonomuraea sp. NPDC047897 TaxID=3364346 RepID=UPI00371ADECC